MRSKNGRDRCVGETVVGDPWHWGAPAGLLSMSLAASTVVMLSSVYKLTAHILRKKYRQIRGSADGLVCVSHAARVLRGAGRS